MGRAGVFERDESTDIGGPAVARMHTGVVSSPVACKSNDLWHALRGDQPTGLITTVAVWPAASVMEMPLKVVVSLRQTL